MKKLIPALLLGAAISHAQIPAPQLNLTGNIGCQGFPCLNSGTLPFTSDANHTMTAQESSAFNIKVTSTVSLTATRNLIAPSGRFSFIIENATTGAQSIQIIGPSGTGVTIPNGQTFTVWNDGTNYVSAGGGGGGSGVSSINGTAGAFTFTGSAVSCASTTCTFTGSSFITSLTTTGSSGPATVTSGVLNIPQYSGGGISALTGDVTASGTGSVAATLATVNTNVGSFGDATHTVTATANAKGLITAISSNAIPIAASGTNGLGSPDNTTLTTTAGMYGLNLAHANTWTASITAPSFISTGSAAGSYTMGQGAAPTVASNSVVLTAPTSVSTGYRIVTPAGGPGTTAPLLLQCSGSSTDCDLNYITGSFQTQLTGTTYSDWSFNGSHADGARLGCLGSNGGTDNNLYCDTPSGGKYAFRIGGTGTMSMGQVTGTYYGSTYNDSLPSTTINGIYADRTGSDKNLYLAAPSGGNLSFKVANVPTLSVIPGSAPSGVCSGNFLELSATDGIVSWCNGSAWVHQISSLTTGFIPKAATGTTLTNSLLDDGITNANGLTYTGAVGAWFTGGSPLHLGPTSTYSAMTLQASAPFTGTMSPFITFTRGANAAQDTTTYGGTAIVRLISAGGIGGSLGDAGNPLIMQWDGTGHLFVVALGSETTGNSDLNGELTLASGTAAYTFATINGAGVHPICVANDTTALNPVQPTYAFSGGVWTVTFHGTGTDVVDYICTGKGVY